VQQVPSLAAGDVNSIGMSIKNIFKRRGERRARRLEAKLPDYDAHAKGKPLC